MTISCPMRGRGSQGKRFSRGKCAYTTIVVGPTRWIAPRSRERLREFESAGGRVIRVTRLDEIAASVRTIRPTVELSPPTSAVRVALRRWPGGGAAFLFNEGEAPYEGVATVSLAGTPIEVDLAAGSAHRLPGAKLSGQGSVVPLSLTGGESILIVFGLDNRVPVLSERRPPALATVLIDKGWEARPSLRHLVGEHDFEIHVKEVAIVPTDRTGSLGQFRGK